MVAKKTLALALILASCASFTEVRRSDVESYYDDAPSWVRKDHREDVYARLKSEKAKGNTKPWVFIALGRYYAEEGLYNLSMKEYNALLKDQPSLPEVRLDIANIYRTQGLYEKAFDEIDDLGDTNVAMNYDKAILLLDQDRPLEALRYVDRALEIDKKHAPSLELKALMYYKNRRYLETREILDALKEVEPENTFAVNNSRWLALTAPTGKAPKSTAVPEEFLIEARNSQSDSHKVIPENLRPSMPWAPTHRITFRDWRGRVWDPSVKRK